LEIVYRLTVADTFELAAKLRGGVVGIAVFVLVFGFGLALFEGVIQIGLGQRLECDEG
jgi:hypothetical protein